jgi:hypothetical protein
MRNEAIVTNGHQFTDKSVRLNPTAFPDRRIALNLYERTDEAIISDSAAVEVRWSNDFDVVAKLHVYDTRRQDFRFTHRQIS